MKKAFLASLAIGLMLVSTIPVLAASPPDQPQAAADSQAKALPIVAVIKASWCPACKKISPTVMGLMKDYGDKATWVVFDVSTKESAEAARKQAEKLGLKDFFAMYGAKTSTVAILDPESKKPLKIFMAEADRSKYVQALETALKSI
ncbi:MAG: thiol-disulfide isomerase [Candidatus Melainabacteria bacterium HGW-Melainabacteria-1]|nr:MAG: thiol-disulfide isomerase [Candidatus Melainabacteria bacterium HGW-Melainabacteria-1]